MNLYESIKTNLDESNKMNLIKYDTKGYVEVTNGSYKGKPIVDYEEKDFKKSTSVLMPFVCDSCGKEFYVKSSIHDFFEQGDFDDPYETPKEDFKCPKCKEFNMSYNGDVWIKEPGVKETITETDDAYMEEWRSICEAFCKKIGAKLLFVKSDNFGYEDKNGNLVHMYADELEQFIKNGGLKESDSSCKYVVYITTQVAPGKFESKSYDVYDTAEQAEDVVNELKGQGINASVVQGNESSTVVSESDDSDDYIPNVWVYSNAEDYDKSNAVSKLYAQYVPEGKKHNLRFELSKLGDMYFTHFIGPKQDLIDYLVTDLGWFNLDEIKRFENNGVIRPYYGYSSIANSYGDTIRNWDSDVNESDELSDFRKVLRVNNTKMKTDGFKEAKLYLYNVILHDANKKYHAKLISREERNKIIDDAHDRLIKGKSNNVLDTVSAELIEKAYKSFIKNYPDERATKNLTLELFKKLLNDSDDVE